MKFLLSCIIIYCNEEGKKVESTINIIEICKTQGKNDTKYNNHHRNV